MLRFITECPLPRHSEARGCDTKHELFELPLLGLKLTSDDRFLSVDMTFQRGFIVGAWTRLPVVDIL